MTNRERERPIFIVGSPRSGTSILATGLGEGAGIAGRSERHLLPLLGRLLHQSTDYCDARSRESTTLESRFRKVHGRLADGLHTMFRDLYAEWHPERVWFDKTPDVDMVRMCPTLLQVWPEARFIYARRRGIENVASRTRKFPDLEFAYHCRNWAENVTVWPRVKPLLGQRYLEIEQREIALNPAGVAQSLQNFLDLTEEQVRGLATALTSERPERTAEPRESRPMTLADTGWSDAQIGVFREFCGPAMRACGYTEGSDYHAACPSPQSAELAPFKNATAALELDHYHGHIDQCDTEMIAGWVQDKRHPHHRLAVELLVDGVVCGTAVADGYRPDLLHVGIGDGRHAFHCRAPQELRDGRCHEVRIRIAGTDRLIDGGGTQRQW